MKKILALVVSMLLAGAVLAGCGGKKLSYYDNLNHEKDYNRNLFYRNDLTELAADPSAIYITEGEEAGYFYMYATSDQIGASGYQAWRSKDLVNWECTGVAFMPDRNSWAMRNYWAPEVIYRDGVYYMYYNAMNYSLGNRHCIGLATATHPAGPFVQWTGKNTDERSVTLSDPLVDFRLLPDELEAEREMAAIDASPFFDDNGDMYLYFVRDLTKNVTQSSIWGMKMKDPYTPDYSTLAQLTECGKQTVGGDLQTGEGNVNEAPFMVKHNGKYYLTFSVNSFWERSYSVAQAIGDSPLGSFTKLSLADGGLVLNAEGSFDHASGTGHHSFVTAGSEMFIVYHAHTDREFGNSSRAIAADRAMFVTNDNGQEVIHVNGPTWSIQPLPETTSGYGNVAKLGSVSADSGGDAKYLTDGVVKIHSYDFVKEFEASDKTTITLTFQEPVIVRAILVYNSYDYEKAFDKIDNITLNCVGENFEGKARIDDLGFDWENYFSEFAEIMRPGGAAIAEFNELTVDSIKITVKAGKAFAISDIFVLGKKA